VATTGEAHDRLVRDEVAGARGRVIRSMGDGYLATFDGPARAIASAEAIVPRRGTSAS